MLAMKERTSLLGIESEVSLLNMTAERGMVEVATAKRVAHPMEDTSALAAGSALLPNSGVVAYSPKSLAYRM